ncbi:MAG TPA: nucleotidyltransferase [Candidatus Limnocylindria bacterium]
MVTEHDPFDPRCATFYCQAMRLLQEARVPFLVGGAFALARYAGVSRFTKDFDIFIHPSDVDRALGALEAAPYRTELTAPHWIAKAFHEDLFVDLIWSSGNGVATVDDEWFAHAIPDDVLGMSALLVPPEEMIWQKAYIMERERFDGADVLHLIHERAEDLDWRHLVRRFADHWHVLLAHLVLFGFAYPTERGRIPPEVMRDLVGRLERDLSGSFDGDRVTQATLLSRYQYLGDLGDGGYKDARLLPPADLTEEDIEECA